MKDKIVAIRHLVEILTVVKVNKKITETISNDPNKDHIASVFVTDDGDVYIDYDEKYYRRYFRDYFVPFSDGGPIQQLRHLARRVKNRIIRYPKRKHKK